MESKLQAMMTKSNASCECSGYNTPDGNTAYLKNEKGLRPQKNQQYSSREMFKERKLQVGIFPAGILPVGILPAGILPAGILPAGILPEGYCQQRYFQQGFCQWGYFQLGYCQRNIARGDIASRDISSGQGKKISK